MSRVVRISEETYALIQADAVPLVDTVDSVLQRWASQLGKTESVGFGEGAQGGEDEMAGTVQNHQFNGNFLNRKYGVGAVQSRYHKGGHWYEKLTQFPGALFDPDGYVLFRTKEDYETCPRLNIGEKLNVKGGISSIVGYKRFPKQV